MQLTYILHFNSHQGKELDCVLFSSLQVSQISLFRSLVSVEELELLDNIA